MHLIKASLALIASASVRQVGLGLVVAFRVVSRMSLGEDLVPYAFIAIHGIYLHGKTLCMNGLSHAIFRATNRATRVICHHGHTPSFSLR